MKTTKHALAAAASIALLSACGGSGDGGAMDMQMGPNPDFGKNYNPIAALGTNNWSTSDVVNASGNFAWFANEIVGNNFTPTTQTDPSAVYNGSMTITRVVPTTNNLNGEVYYGRMQMDVNFANSAVTGAVGNFGLITVTSTPGGALSNVSGSGTISGTLDTSGLIDSTMIGSLAGTAMTGNMTGEFFTHTDTGRELITGGGSANIGSAQDAGVVFLLTK